MAFERPGMIGTSLIFRIAVVFFGVALLLFGVGDLLIPRARFVDSTPAAGAVIANPPAVVRINFSNKLAPESTMEVTSTIKLWPSGETEYWKGDSVVASSGIDRTDPSGKSLRANLRPGLHPGLYWVNWRTTAEGWRTGAFGKTYFSVGMPAPRGIISDMDGAVWEQTYDWRRRRGALVGGLVLLALGVFGWRSKAGRGSVE